MQFHVAGTLEFFVNHIVHAAAGVYQTGRDNRQRAAIFNIAGRAEKPFGWIQRHRINAAGEGTTRRGHVEVVGTSEARDRIHQHHHILAAFDQTFRPFQRHLRYFGMIFDWLIKGRSDDFAPHRTAHIGHFFGAFADQQHHQVNIGVVGRDAVGDGFHQHRFARFGRRHNQPTLATPNRSHQIHNPRGQDIGFGFQHKLFVGENRHQLLEVWAFTRLFGINAIDEFNAQQAEIPFAFLWRTNLAGNAVAGA